MKDNGYNNNYNSNLGNNSNLTFWMAANCSTSPVVVTVDSQTAQISQYYPNGQPGCAAFGCANFNLRPGTYIYVATASDSTWRGSVTVPSAGCRIQQLQCSMGNVTFWVDSAANNTRVTISGNTSHISVAFPTSTPTCGTQGCANFTLPTGTYSYTAITSTNIGYTGSVTVNDTCTLVKLY
jgi:hypothetical protein